MNRISPSKSLLLSLFFLMMTVGFITSSLAAPLYTPPSGVLGALALCTVDGTDLESDRTNSSNIEPPPIELLEFSHQMAMRVDQPGRIDLARGVSYQPVKFVKRIDKTSPLLYKALTLNQPIDCTIRFYRQNNIDGGAEQYYTIELLGGRVSTISHDHPSSLTYQTASRSSVEIVSLVFQNISWTYESGGAQTQATVFR